MSSTPERSVAPTIDLDAEIGRRVHQLMWDRQITQTALGAQVGMDQSSVAKRFRGTLKWSAMQVKNAADALDTSVAYLYGETEDPTPPNLRTMDYRVGASATVHDIAKERARRQTDRRITAQVMTATITEFSKPQKTA